ncbi:MAG: helix-turn-helix domain-containing protein [Acutalibacteraceae bacterium]
MELRNDIVLYTVMEVSKILRIGKNRVYELIELDLLPALNLGGLKVRKESLEKFLADYEGYDLSDLMNIKRLSLKAEIA